MTSISQAFSRQFSDRVRSRGAGYFRDGRVRIESGSPWHVTASVRGSALYEVELRREGTTVHVGCTCPYFAMDICKHIWAVMLAADARQLLAGDDRQGEAALLEVGADPEDEDDPFDDVPTAGTRESRRSTASAPRQRAPQRDRAPDWRRQLAALEPRERRGETRSASAWPASRELLYVIDVVASRGAHGVQLELVWRDLKKDGTPGQPKSRSLPRELPDCLPDAADRRILAMLAGASEHHAPLPAYAYSARFQGAYGDLPAHYSLLETQSELLLPEICRTGRCRLRLQPGDDHRDWLAVAWEDAEPWRFEVDVGRSPRDKHYELTGVLRRGTERMDLAAPLLLAKAGILFTREHAARYEHGGTFDWIALLREHGRLRVPPAQRDELMAALYAMPALPPLELPAELRYEQVEARPRPCLAVRAADRGLRQERFRGRLSFDYGGTAVAHGEPGYGIVQAGERRVLRRDPAAEREAEQRLEQLGWRPAPPDYASTDDKPALEIPANRLPQVARELVAAGWHVEAGGRPYRSPGAFEFQVASGVDWFELHGTIEFGDTVAELPELLAAARRGEHWVPLGDGSFGLLPEDWLAKYGALAELGKAEADHLRFERSQVGLLDALLAAQPEVRGDAHFTRLRKKLGDFKGVRAVEAPAGFRGELRPYQKEGLGWLNFLREFGFGGCLADDMGLGKTVQVLALLEAQRARRARGRGADRKRGGRSAPKTPAAPAGPSLVVAPKSLIFNWAAEAARFAPRLRVLDHTGPQRRKGHEHFGDYDLILTTYGTLRSDIGHFKDARFDYAILDEAQAIKNASSASAKAARLLNAEHRLALSGTPVENHIGELWSLFEFLNPGMLGQVSAFRKAHGNNALDDEARELLARALRPFLLRRTKEQVLRDLPPKVEQTLYCELPVKQRADYDKLRKYYRGALLERIERDGINRSKLQILEALLRLRQAAIHPGLIDRRRGSETSAKLDMLLHRVQEVLDEGHKVLVFSQFTEMLAILRSNLDGLGVSYEYLDGRTRKREKRVERFQNDADCRLFLISLKAGGVGLNLTAAEYVFLLDPWWNPAVEMQAVDRAHRIGQRNRVFAYRLIARDTIEEKVLELQDAKRDLADAIVGGDKDLIRTLGKDDLELLLA